MGKIIDFNEAVRKKKGINKEDNGDSTGNIQIIDDIDITNLLNGFMDYMSNPSSSEDSLKDYFGFDKKGNKDKKGE